MQNFGSGTVTVKVSNQSVNQEKAEKIAQWEKSIRLSRGYSSQFVVSGWTDSKGEIWDVNEIITIDAPIIGLKGEYLINSVTLQQTDSDQTATIGVCDPNAYKAEPNIESKDVSQGMGWSQ